MSTLALPPEIGQPSERRRLVLHCAICGWLAPMPRLGHEDHRPFCRSCRERLDKAREIIRRDGGAA
ncbi:MAG: hypothetical protein LUO93_02135 [Methanomicrobiales archaeon]|nr:hypothetical protein [Methanomicrobiales archaeon]